MKTSLFIILTCFFFVACKKESFITSGDANIYTSADTLFFDTVFTNVGSVTHSFKIFNSNDQKLRLSMVKLAGGIKSPFKMNVDGTAASEINDVELNANDSLYVFVQLNVDPGASNLPFIITDSIQIEYNGNTKWVQLHAYGQNAIFLTKEIITSNQTWDSTLPYVIKGSLQITTGATLQINPGTKIYLHADAPVLVDGTLRASGTWEHPIVFSGDRLDADYKDLPGSWPGIYFRPSSKDNYLKHTFIKNAYQGIIAQELSTTSQPKLTLSQCVIDNIYDIGILGINTDIQADNCLISNCGSNILLAYGGDYRFVHCTVATYGSYFINHKNPVLQVADFVEDGGTVYTAPLNAFFQNCIFWGENGTVETEVLVGRKGQDDFSVTFDHVLYKAKDDPTNAEFISSIKNIPPAFDSINASKNIYNFHLKNNSPAINAGATTLFLYDLDGKSRDAEPDIGCYER